MLHYPESTVFVQPDLLLGPPVRRRELSVGGKVLGVEEFAVVDVGLPFKMVSIERGQINYPRLSEFRVLHALYDMLFRKTLFMKY